MRVLVRKLRSGFRKPAFVLLWLAPVWLMLTLCRVSIRVLSLRRLASLLGVAHGASACIPLVTEDQRQRAAKIGQVVQLAARYVPWGANCYPQALTACLLLVLYRVPHCLCFGVARDPQSHGFSAHAWTAAGKVRVTGRESFNCYTVIACFVSLPGLVNSGPNVDQGHDQQPSLAIGGPIQTGASQTIPPPLGNGEKNLPRARSGLPARAWPGLDAGADEGQTDVAIHNHFASNNNPLPTSSAFSPRAGSKEQHTLSQRVFEWRAPV